MSDAEDRGWGPGWPTGVPSSQLVQVDVSGTKYPGGVRSQVADMVRLLTTECKARGYVFGVPGDPAYGCWGYANRPISGTNEPSNHSWGLAVDVNAPRNPQKKPLTTDMPAWLPDLWKRYGWGWGGDYTNATPDPMHFEYMGTPDQAAADTARCHADLAGNPPTPGADPMSAYVVKDAHSTSIYLVGPKGRIGLNLEQWEALIQIGVPNAAAPPDSLLQQMDIAAGLLGRVE